MNEMADDRFIEERINGVIYLMARPNRKHLRIQYNLCKVFNDYFEAQDKDCEAVFEDEIRINKDDKIVPDVLVYCYDCFNEDDKDDLPLIVIEVLSKSTRKKDLTVKMKKYAELGVKEYWVINYKELIMDIYVLENEQYNWTITCGIEDEGDETGGEDGNKDILPEFSPVLFPDMTVKATDIFRFAKKKK